MTMPVPSEEAIMSRSALTRSLFEEVYDGRLWDWYREWGIVDRHPCGIYLRYEGERPVFDGRVLEEAVVRGWLARLRSSVVFPFRASRALRAYDPISIDRLYAEEASRDLSCFSKDELRARFEAHWRLLVENMKYSILASLVLQYGLRLELRPQYLIDIQAKRHNDFRLFGLGRLGRDALDAEYGFLSTSDYDFAAPRYSELARLPPPARAEVPAHDGAHNLREHIRFRSAKLVALIRKTLLTLDPKAFSMTYEEVLAGKRSARQAAPGGAPLRLSSAPLAGVCLSGAGSAEGKARVICRRTEYAQVRDGEIAVVKTLDPDLVILFPLVRAIVAETGGKLSHAAVIGREQGVLIIGQVPSATKRIKNGSSIRVDESGAVEISPRISSGRVQTRRSRRHPARTRP